MSYHCAHCGGNHRSPETGKKCAEAPERRRRRARNEKIDMWAPSKTVPTETAPPKSQLLAEYIESLAVPNGHYYIPPQTWGSSGAHFLVRQFQEGRWAELWFVTGFDMDTGTAQFLSGVYDRSYAVLEIQKSGPMDCMVEYGKLFLRCAVCSEELSEEEAEGTGGHVECFREAFKT